MFSPAGKKKILLQQKFGLTISSPTPSIRSNSNSNSPERERGSLSPDGGRLSVNSSPGKNNMRSASPFDEKRPKTTSKASVPTNLVATTSQLEKALTHPGLLGDVMKKLMAATARYHPDRDSIIVKAFESRHITYQLFRSNLATYFSLMFKDEEYEALTEYLDPNEWDVIDGYAFMIVLTRLNAMRKDMEAMSVREKQQLFEENLKVQKEREQFLLEKKMEMAVDFKFSAEVRQSAVKKLEFAAKNYDPAHPSAVSVRTFQVPMMKTAEFRERLKSTFNLKVDAGELGAILKEFKEDISGNEIPASDFLRFFLRLGFEAREKEKQAQRNRQKELDLKAEEEKEKKAQEKASKLKTFVDFNFSETDESRANEKLLAASIKYDPKAPGSVSLEGFECEELSPLDFRELIRRVFNVTMAAKELGYVIQKFDVKKSGNVHCKTFITEFLRQGHEGRHKSHIEQLELQRKLNEQAEKNHLEKIKSVQMSDTVAISKKFTEEDLKSALKKLTKAAVFYDKERSVSLASFESKSLNLVHFKRALKKTFNIELTGPEMGALYNDLEKNDENEVLCHNFLTLFIALGAEERAKQRSEQILKQKEAERLAREEAEQKRLDVSSKILYDVDYNWQQEDMESALAKLTVAATKVSRQKTIIKIHPHGIAKHSLTALHCTALHLVAVYEIV